MAETRKLCKFARMGPICAKNFPPPMSPPLLFPLLNAIIAGQPAYRAEQSISAPILLPQNRSVPHRDRGERIIMNGQLSHRHAHKFRLGGSIDMLTGPLLKKILLFGLPLMASSILQLLFNAADVVVLGRYASYASLAAVGSTTAIVNLMINLLIGISIGVNVLVARYLGEGDKQKELSEAVHTAVAVALIGGVILGGIGCATASWILELISTPEDIFDLARIYLNIYFLGTPAIAVYNYGAAILRARGDTQRPLLFLTVSGVTNVALNLLFVISFQMDVAGVALATVISEVLSAVLVLVSLMRSQDELAFSWRKLRIHRRSLSLMSKVGIPAGIQGCLFSLANLAIQGAINAYGSVVVAGSSAAGSIDGFIYVSMNTFHQTAQTFLSQNIGAGKYDRVKDILKKCLLCTVVTGAILCTVACVFSQPLLRIYNQDPAVVAAGTVRLYIAIAPYIIFGLADVLTGAIRGCGSPVRPVVINLLCTCVFRLLWISAINTDTVPVTWVYASYPASWLVLLIALTVCWLRLYRRKIRPHLTPD